MAKKTEPKFTPGNWKLDDGDSETWAILAEGAERAICWIDVGVGNDEMDQIGWPEAEARAIANLICAAKDMYNALDGLLSIIEDSNCNYNHKNKAYAALAKARGEV